MLLGIVVGVRPQDVPHDTDQWPTEQGAHLNFSVKLIKKQISLFVNT